MEAGAFAWDSIKNYVKRALPSTMLITRKMNGEEVDKCKGRWVCGGHCEQYSNETFAPTPHAISFRCCCAIAAKHGYTLESGDITTAFLTGDLDEEGVVMRPPKGIEPSPMDKGYERVKNLDTKHQILVIYKALYGLSRSPKLHMSKLRRVLEYDGFRSTDAEPCVYVKKLWNEDGTPKMVEQRRPPNSPTGDVLPLVQDQYIILIHVDDILAMSPHGGAMDHLVKLLKNHGMTLEVKPITHNKKSYFVGVEILQSEDKFTVSLGVSGFLSRLAKEILGEPKESWNTKTFQVPMTAKYKSKTNMLVPGGEGDRVISAEEFPYRKCIGALLWANVARPDICQAVRQLSRFCLKPTEQHVEAAIHLLKYCYNTRDRTINYSGGSKQKIPYLRKEPTEGQDTTDLNQFTSNYYGGHVYDAASSKWLDAKDIPSELGQDPPAEGQVRVKDDSVMVDIDPTMGMYTDASFQSTFDFKSVSGHVTFFGSAAVDWGSHTQSVVAMSTMESEIFATTKGTQSLLHVRTLLHELGEVSILEPVVSFEDNKAAKLCLAVPDRRKGAKHFERMLARAHQWVQAKVVKYVYCRTDEMVADVFTKPMEEGLFQKFTKLIFNESDTYEDYA